jgi:hypothetical protein
MEIFQKKIKTVWGSSYVRILRQPLLHRWPQICMRVCHYKKYGGVKTYIQYTYDTRSGERCSETEVRCC